MGVPSTVLLCGHTGDHCKEPYAPTQAFTNETVISHCLAKGKSLIVQNILAGAPPALRCSPSSGRGRSPGSFLEAGVPSRPWDFAHAIPSAWHTLLPALPTNLANSFCSSHPSWQAASSRKSSLTLCQMVCNGSLFLDLPGRKGQVPRTENGVCQSWFSMDTQ